MLPLIELDSKGHKLTFNPNPKKHIYTLDGIIVPGVTSVNKGGYPTSPKLIAWFMKNGSKSKTIASEAADVGKILHKYAELRVLSEQDRADLLVDETVEGHEYEKEIRNCIALFEEWFKTNSTITVASELMLASWTYQFAGTLDRLSINPQDELGIEDYKTSSGFFVDQFVQMAGYKIALNEWRDQSAKWFRVNLFGKKKASFHTLMVNKSGWFLDGKLYQEDSFAMQKLEAQFLRNRKTYAFAQEYDNLFDGVYDSIKGE